MNNSCVLQNPAIQRKRIDQALIGCCLLIALIVLTACGGQTRTAEPVDVDTAIHQNQDHDPDAELPILKPVDLADGGLLNVVATSNIVADIVGGVGGDFVQLTNLLPTGADPHSYEPKPADLRALHDADVVFINGLGLEEAMASVLSSPDANAPIISVNVGVDPTDLDMAEEEDGVGDGQEDDHDDHDVHDHASVDPHTWMDVSNVIRWTETVAFGLGELDPDHRADYMKNAQRLQADLAALDAEIRSKVGDLPADGRKLVTDHDSLGYYARAYGFDVIGSVVASFSTLASPSAQQLAALQEQIDAENVNAIFVSTAINPQTANQIATDMGIDVVPLYIGSLSDVNGPAATYIEFMRHNTDSIVGALKQAQR